MYVHKARIKNISRFYRTMYQDLPFSYTPSAKMYRRRMFYQPSTHNISIPRWAR